MLDLESALGRAVYLFASAEAGVSGASGEKLKVGEVVLALKVLLAHALKQPALRLFAAFLVRELHEAVRVGRLSHVAAVRKLDGW